MDHRPKYEIKNIYWETLNLEKSCFFFFFFTQQQNQTRKGEGRSEVKGKDRIGLDWKDKEGGKKEMMHKGCEREPVPQKPLQGWCTKGVNRSPCYRSHCSCSWCVARTWQPSHLPAPSLGLLSAASSTAASQEGPSLSSNWQKTKKN